MMKAEKSFTVEEQIAILDSVLKKERVQLAEFSPIFVFWGWLVIAALILHFLMIQFQVGHHWVGWYVLMPLGIICQFFFVPQLKRMEWTFIRRLIALTWLGFFICFTFSLLLLQVVRQFSLIPIFIMAFYTLALFISGVVLRFKPMIVGSIFNWALLFSLCFWIETILEMPILTIPLNVVAMVVSYLIPGYLLKRSIQSI